MSVFKFQQQVLPPVTGGKHDQEDDQVESGPDDVNVDVAKDPSVEEGEKYIKIDGPVGRIYTDALQSLLANESYMTMVPSDDVVIPEEGSIEVYAAPVNNIEYLEVVRIMNEATLHANRTYVVAAEALDGKVGVMGRRLELLSALKNVKVCYTRQAALNAIRAHL